MTINVAGSGEACCGNCGSHVVVACSGGCSEPDVVFRENYIATMKKPSGGQIGPRRPQNRSVILRPGYCVVAGCELPVTEYSGRGRVPIRCVVHVKPTRAKAKP